MARPIRSASLKARELFNAGVTTKDIDNAMGPDLPETSRDEFDPEIGESSDEEDVTPKCFHLRRPKRKQAQAKGLPSYEDKDISVDKVPFRPSRVPGPQIMDRITRNGIMHFTRALDFFKLFFTVEFIAAICENTNIYGSLHILEKQTYAKATDGSWINVTEDEMYRFIGLIIFMGLVQLPDIPRYWSEQTLYGGGWARRFLSRNRFKAIMGMLHVCHPDKEVKADKLTKVREAMQHIKGVCMSLYQPLKNLSVDERMVATRSRSPIQQFMPKKPARFGCKLWCICDSSNGYTIDFDVYTGRRETPSTKGLGYDVVMGLSKPFQRQGYCLFFDNYFTSLPLLTDLAGVGIQACGTMNTTRRGFPKDMKDKKWGKKAKRGDMRYSRNDQLVCLQWKDSKPVCVASTIHSATDYVMVRRNKKVLGQHRNILIRQPLAIRDYNKNMGGVDVSDQLISSYNVLLKSCRWWRTLFLHFIDIAVVNSYILFMRWRQMHPEIPELQRCAEYAQLHFREELVRQLAEITDDEGNPEFNPGTQRHYASAFTGLHIPQFMDDRKNCKVCYLKDKVEHKTPWQCLSPQCGVYLCMTRTRNCANTWHASSFEKFRKMAR